MNDAEIIRHLAEKVMGWRLGGTSTGLAWHSSELAVWYSSELAFQRFANLWNPLESIADAFEVQAKIPEDKQAACLGHLECIVVPAKRFNESDMRHVWALFDATPRQRCLAMVEATR